MIESYFTTKNNVIRNQAGGVVIKGYYRLCSDGVSCVYVVGYGQDNDHSTEDLTALFEYECMQHTVLNKEQSFILVPPPVVRGPLAQLEDILW